MTHGNVFFFFPPSTQWGGDGEGSCAHTLSFIYPTTIGSAVELYFPFDINTVLELSCWGEATLQTSWPFMLEATADVSGIRMSKKKFWSAKETFGLFSFPFSISPFSLGQLPIPFWETMTLSYDSWVFFCCCHWTFFLYLPFFFSLSPSGFEGL